MIYVPLQHGCSRTAVIQADGTEVHTLFHYGLQGELLGETRLNGRAANQSAQTSHTQNIVWLQMRPVAVLDTTADSKTTHNTRIAWLHSDHLFTARAATDEHQRLIWRWRSDAFGVGEEESFAPKDNPSAQAFTLNLRFPGQYHDEESGLYYNYFRTYDPAKGRYTQSDPIGLAGGVNTFGYVASNPLALIDPLGLVIWEGTYRVITATAPVGATVGYFWLESECAYGLKGTALVLFIGPALGLGLEISGSEGQISFEMHRDDVAPWEFQGSAAIFSAAIKAGELGGGVGKIVHWKCISASNE